LKRRDLGDRVDKDGNTGCLGDLDALFQRTLSTGSIEPIPVLYEVFVGDQETDHRRLITDGALHLIFFLNLDDAPAGGLALARPSGVVQFLQYDLVLHALGKGQALNPFGIASGDAGAGSNENRTGRSGSYQGARDAGESGDLLAGRLVRSRMGT